MAKTVSQPSWLPTNKLTGALVAAAAWELFGPWMIAYGVSLGLPVGGPAVTAVAQIGIAALAGYLIKDKPNV